MMKVTLKNMDTGVTKTSPTGYSWTTLFFGFFPAIFRGDFKGAMIGLLGGLVGAWLFFAIFAAFYNKLYIKDLMGKRYTYADEATRLYLIEKGIIQE